MIIRIWGSILQIIAERPSPVVDILKSKLRVAEVDHAGGRSLKMLEWMLFIIHHLFVHFRISSSLSFQRKTKRHVLLLLFVLTLVHLNWPSYATGKCYRSPRQLIATMNHWWLYITIHSLTMFKWKIRNLRLNLIYLSFFVQYISLPAYSLVKLMWPLFSEKTSLNYGIWIIHRL